MKIGILSMQRIENYGSFLQAYALKKILESMGSQVVFVDIECSRISRVKSNKIKLYKIKLLDRYFRKRIQLRKKNRQMKIMFGEYQKKYLGLSETMQTAVGCDAVVIGSDEIFNCASDSMWGVTPQRFGKIEGVPITISYAASCGFTDRSMLSSSDEIIVKEALKKMQSISVRDYNTFKFVKQMIGYSPEINLDPVLISDFQDEMKIAELKGIPKYPYMIVYAYHNRISDFHEIHAIQNYAKKKGLRTIAIGGSLPWCDEMAVIDPFQVLVYFKNAFCVVTDTFHGCIMAAKFSKPLAVLVRDSNRNKLEDLLDRVDIRKHKVNDMNMLEQVLEMEDNYSEFHRIVKLESEKSRTYLQKALHFDLRH